MIKYVSSLVFAIMFLFVGTAQAATITGAGQVISVGVNSVVIWDTVSSSYLTIDTTAGVTTWNGGTTAFAQSEYVTFTGNTTAVAGSVTPTTMSVYPKISFVLAPTAAQVGTPLAPTNLLTSGTAPFAVTVYTTTAAQVAAAGLPGTVESYNVPAGMTISAAGILSGTPTTAGMYNVSLFAKDAIGNSMSSAILIEVTAAPVVVPPPSTPVDTTAPVITMNGTDVSLIVGTSYVDLGATCVDNIDSTCTVVTTSTVNTTTAGTYTVTYDATDAAGNVATPVVRTVTVDAAPDTIAPVITMNGSNVTLTAGTSYVDAGATCVDNVDPTCTVTTTSTVNTAIAGTYTVTYSAKDAAGNVATPVVRTVTVNAAPVVVITPTPTPTPAPTPAPTTGYTSTGKKVEAKGIVATHDTVSNVMTLTNGVVLRITATTKVKLNGYILSAVGGSAQYKGIKNTDGSVTLTSIEIN